MRKMTIGIDVRLWDETGVGRYIRNLVENLREIDSNNNYILFSIRRNLAAIKSSFGNYKNWQIVEADIRWHSIAEQFVFPKILNKYDLDLAYFPYFSIPVFYKKPYCIMIHDLIIDHFSTGKATSLPYPFYKFKKFLYHLTVRNAVSKALKIIVPSRATKDELIKHYGVKEEKIKVIYEAGFNASINKDDSILKKIKEKYFLYVGNVYPHKNIEQFINAFIKFLKDKKEDVQLVFVGREDFFYKKLKKRVKKYTVQKNIAFLNNVTDKELKSLYANAIALVSPSLMEGFGLTPLEAMSSSCLALISNIPAFKEICSDVSFYFNPKDKLSMKNSLEMIYNLDFKIKVEHLRLGLERSEKFSWKKTAEETLRIYESCFSIRQSK